MRKKLFSVTLVLVLLLISTLLAIDGGKAQLFVGNDAHMTAGKFTSYQSSTVGYELVFENGFDLAIGANRYSCDNSVVFLESFVSESGARQRVDYKAKVYLEGNVSAKHLKKAKMVSIKEVVIEKGKSVLLEFDITGEVLVTADVRAEADIREMDLYKRAVKSDATVSWGPNFVVQSQAIVPKLSDITVDDSGIIQLAKAKKPKADKFIVEGKTAAEATATEAADAEATDATGTKVTNAEATGVGPGEEVFVAGTGESQETKTADSGVGVKTKTKAKADKGPLVVQNATAAEQQFLDEQQFEPVGPTAAVVPEEKEPEFRYPVRIFPVGDEKWEMDSIVGPDGMNIATVTQRFYLSQKRDEKGNLLELQADMAVIYYSGEGLKVEKNESDEDILATGPIDAIYMAGDVVLTEGQRTIRTDEMYYDFRHKKAIAINSVMKTFDPKRGIPIYIRAYKLRQLSENQFAAENVVVTSSEFNQPQVSLEASSVYIADTTTIDEEIKDSSYDAQMRDIRMKMGKRTVFYWPYLRSNLERPDWPLKSIRFGQNSRQGTSAETRWYLAKLMGWKEAEGTDSTLAVDYFSKRGVGVGAEIEYEKDDYYGRLLGYVINDSGKDKLGRHDTRDSIDHSQKLRGRADWLHRQFLPYNWQLTTGISYASDKHFIESYYRSEFSVGNYRETYVHLKRIEDNWALSFLAKPRLNDFEDELEELPSAEYHLTGQSLFDDTVTMYSDSELGRLRQRIGNDNRTNIDENHFTFGYNRTELDMPLRADPFKIVPFVAGTFAFDDRSGFRRTLVDGSNTGRFGSEAVFIGEAGVRMGTQFHKVYPNVKSRLWDLNQLRHIVRPEVTVVGFAENDSVVRQHNLINFGLKQRLQTKRGPADNQQTVDWMRLNVDATFVDDDESPTQTGPDRFIWNRTIVPMRVMSAPEIFNGDLDETNFSRFENWGPRRDYIGADYIWRLSDTSAILSDMYYDVGSGVLQQFNIGYSRMVWPNMSFYVGSRYLRRVYVNSNIDNVHEKGSNAFTFAITYVLDPRYTITFSQQYDFDYGKGIRSEVTLIRRYHRMFCSFTYSADESLQDQMIVLSIWPQGVPEMSMGQRRYSGISSPTGY